MTNVIVDNSTLSSVERVIGNIPVRPAYDLSGDLSAFDAYLAALLFYDNPVRIDDYKAEHSEARAKAFPELGTVSFQEGSYDQLLSAARELSQNTTLSIRGGDVEGNELGQFLHDIDLHVCPAWVMQSSDFFLRIRLLSDHAGAEVEKYTPLMSAIFDQLGENKNVGAKPDWRKTLVDSQGKPIKEIAGSAKSGAHRIGSDIHAFAAGLNWLSFRSVFYALAAEKLEAATVCHPIRNDYLARFVADKLNDLGPDQRSAIIQEVQETTAKLLNDSNRLLGGSGFKVRAPLVSAWAALKAGSPREARNFVNDIRHSPEAVALRARLREIEGLVTSGDMLDAREDATKLFKDYQISADALFRKYAAKGDDPYGVSVNLIGMSGSFKLSTAKDKLASLLPKRSRSLALLRNITRDLIQSPSLGKVSDLLRSDRKIEGDDWDPVYSPKVDPPRFRYIKAYWKKPM